MIAIPTGWRKLRQFEVLRKGDKFYSFSSKRWKLTRFPGVRVDDMSLDCNGKPFTYIRLS